MTDFSLIILILSLPIILLTTTLLMFRSMYSPRDTGNTSCSDASILRPSAHSYTINPIREELNRQTRLLETMIRKDS